jgi:hypothetical protein
MLDLWIISRFRSGVCPTARRNWFQSHDGIYLRVILIGSFLACLKMFLSCVTNSLNKDVFVFLAKAKGGIFSKCEYNVDSIYNFKVYICIGLHGPNLAKKKWQ